MEWDDYRIFLALIRTGTVRAAAQQLNTSHSTVARKIDAFETRFGAKLFVRSNAGYALTPAGEQLIEAAEAVETELLNVQRRVKGQDQKIAGDIRLTLPNALASQLLMPELAKFMEVYPEINLDIIATYESLDLSRQEADIALRFVQSPPENLIGRHLADVAFTGYATRSYIENHDLEDPNSASWIGFSKMKVFPNWRKLTGYPHLPVRGIFNSVYLMLAAAKCGLGAVVLPCYVGDPDPELVRLPKSPVKFMEQLWLLRHTDLRTTTRLQIFSEFITEAIARNEALIRGEMPGETAVIDDVSVANLAK